jgi:hypothetical protein
MIVHRSFNVKKLFPAIGQRQRMLSWIFMTFLSSFRVEQAWDIDTCWFFDIFELPRRRTKAK